MELSVNQFIVEMKPNPEIHSHAVQTLPKTLASSMNYAYFLLSEEI